MVDDEKDSGSQFEFGSRIVVTSWLWIWVIAWISWIGKTEISSNKKKSGVAAACGARKLHPRRRN